MKILHLAIAACAILPLTVSQPALSAGKKATARSVAARTGSSVPQFKVLQTIPLGGEGEWGYPTIDVDARRLYLPRTNVVQVIDLDRVALVGTIANVTKQVSHGVAIVPGGATGFTSAGKDNNVAVFDPHTLQITRRIDVSGNPNFIMYDRASDQIVVNSHAAVTLIRANDPNAAPVTLDAGDGLESGVADGKGNVFVSAENDNLVVRIDTKINQVTARWPVAPCAFPAGMAMDHKTNRLFVSCHNKVGATPSTPSGVLAVIDANTGTLLATPAIGAGASGVVFDPQLGVALAANGKDGTVSVVKETSPGHFQTVQTIKTSVSARHIALDPRTHRFFLEGNLPGGEINFGVLVLGI